MNLDEYGVDVSGPNDRLAEPEPLPGEIDDDTLRKYFTLTKTDLEQVDQCRGPANKLGFAIQLCTLRWHGYFLPDTRGVPSSVVEMIGSQLALLPIPPDSYPQNEKTRFEHLERIRQHGLNLAKGKISAKVNWQTVSGYSCFTRHASTAHRIRNRPS